ncbi:MAG: hypothetical protein DRJ66_04920 [Thermoprotei archaeon]|nr:MAG: hypothetical protein DRJ66_04920 [Thermoprotei archaeon]RLF17997.1 MAG: hypothetical protein DRZ82_09045 [Thermoprotei archaeon]
MEKQLLTILLWLFLLELICVVYYIAHGYTWRFEFKYTLFLLIVTLLIIVLILTRIRKELRDQYVTRISQFLNYPHTP